MARKLPYEHSPEPGEEGSENWIIHVPLGSAPSSNSPSSTSEPDEESPLPEESMPSE